VKLAILGPKFSGKTTVFNALTGAEEELSDFSGAGKEHRRDVHVPDARLDRLADDFKPKKISPARVEFLDLPAYGGSEKFFGDARQNQALILVVRAYAGDAIPHPRSRIDWRADLEDIETDFVLQDLAMVERRLERLEKNTKRGPSYKTYKEDMADLELYKKVLPSLSDGVALKKSMDAEEQAKLAPFGFLTLKPTLTVVNIGDDDDPTALGIDDDGSIMPIKARLEAEVAQLDEEDRGEFLTDFGLDEPIRDRLIRHSYALLGQQSFLTAGPKEVRAWTITAGDTAVQAAKVIHSDIARGFIRAEVVSWEDYCATGGWKAAKEAKKMRLEGKEYLMQDGDVVEFRHGG
jgi:GTP-binding protein YchF